MESLTPQRLEVILSQMVESRGWHRAQWIRWLSLMWRDVVGETLADQSKILSLTSDGLLWVAVSSSVWAQQLLYFKPRIIETFHELYPDIPLTDLRTRTQGLPTRGPVSMVDYQRSPYVNLKRPVSLIDNLEVLLSRVQEKYQEAAMDWLAHGFHPCARCHAPTANAYKLCVVCELDRKTPER